jgi:aspartyl protease family protein
MVASQRLSKWLIFSTLAALAAMATARANRDMLVNGISPAPTANAAVLSPELMVPEPKLKMPLSEPSGQLIARASDGLFYVNASVNGQPLRFIVDTGASIIVLTEADARRIGIAMNEGHYNTSVETVGGSTDMAMTTLTHVRIAGREVRQLRAAVVRNGLGVSLLGLNALSQLGSVTIQGDRLSFH